VPRSANCTTLLSCDRLNDLNRPRLAPPQMSSKTVWAIDVRRQQLTSMGSMKDGEYLGQLYDHRLLVNNSCSMNSESGRRSIVVNLINELNYSLFI
jgi:hypothetical protein